MTIVNISPRARDHFLELCTLHQQPHVRLSLRSRGCNGNSYAIDFAEGPVFFDEMVALDETHNFYIDGYAVMRVVGTFIDWIEGGLESKLLFSNPNVVSACGCGESFQTEGRRSCQ
jgi:iron-sulfur cluster assembly protein